MFPNALLRSTYYRILLVYMNCLHVKAEKVYFWEHSNHRGDWYSVDIKENECVTFPNAWNDRISSIKSQENLCIVVWEHSNCRGKSLKIPSHYKHLHTEGFNDAISSFQLCSKSESGSGDDTFSESDIAKVGVDAHNQYRKRHGVQNLEWDSKLEQAAQKHADLLAKTHQFHHSKNGYGENLAGVNGDTKEDAVQTAVNLWYDEIKNYNYDQPDFSQSTGHFTQVVWANSKKLGVGVAWDSARNWWIVCANYSPRGNFGGEYEKNVKRPQM